MVKSKSRLKPYGISQGILCRKIYANNINFLFANELEVDIIKEWHVISESELLNLNHPVTSVKNRMFVVTSKWRKIIVLIQIYFFLFLDKWSYNLLTVYFSIIVYQKYIYIYIQTYVNLTFFVTKFLASIANFWSLINGWRLFQMTFQPSRNIVSCSQF